MKNHSTQWRLCVRSFLTKVALINEIYCIQFWTLLITDYSMKSCLVYCNLPSEAIQDFLLHHSTDLCVAFRISRKETQGYPFVECQHRYVCTSHKSNINNYMFILYEIICWVIRLVAHISQQYILSLCWSIIIAT